MDNKTIKWVILFLIICAIIFFLLNRCDNNPHPQPITPVLFVSVDSLNFIDSSFATFCIKNIEDSDENLAWQLKSNVTWLDINPKSGKLPGNESDTIYVSVIREKWMSPGIHRGEILINSNGGNCTVFVSMHIEQIPVELPIMLIDPPGLNFEFIENDSEYEKSEQLYISGSNDSTFDWSADISDNSVNWLSIKPESGFNNSLMTVIVNSKAMLPGEYTGYVKLYAGNVVNKTANVPVVMKVLPKPPEPEKPWVLKFEAEKEYNQGRNGKWWISVVDSGRVCLRARDDFNEPIDSTAVVFEFDKPDSIDAVYVFASINVENGDGFFIGMNYANQSSNYICKWFELYDLIGDGWNLAYVYNWTAHDRMPYHFKLKNGVNYLVIYPGRAHAKIDWIAVTNRGDLVLENIKF